MVEMADYYLESSREELKQLEKMYRSKDLTEETEEFILKRTRFEVRMAEFFVKMSRIRAEETLKIELPRREKDLHDNSAKAEVALEKAVSTLPLALQQRRLGLQKMKYDYAKNAEKLERLEKDRETMTVRASTRRHRLSRQMRSRTVVFGRRHQVTARRNRSRRKKSS